MTDVTSTDFCRQCGEMLDLQSFSYEIACQKCKATYAFEEFVGKPIKTKIVITEGKQWLAKYQQEAKKDKVRTKKMKIQESCPKCSNPEMLYYTAQTRSADEGSTLFYECPKCHYTYTHNN